MGAVVIRTQLNSAHHATSRASSAPTSTTPTWCARSCTNAVSCVRSHVGLLCSVAVWAWGKANTPDSRVRSEKVKPGRCSTGGSGASGSLCTCSCSGGALGGGGGCPPVWRRLGGGRHRECWLSGYNCKRAWRGAQRPHTESTHNPPGAGAAVTTLPGPNKRPRLAVAAEHVVWRVEEVELVS